MVPIPQTGRGRSFPDTWTYLANRFLFRFQAVDDDEVEATESRLWFDVIEQFVSAKEFYTPFMLRLLVNSLNTAINKPKAIPGKTPSPEQTNSQTIKNEIENFLNEQMGPLPEQSGEGKPEKPEEDTMVVTSSQEVDEGKHLRAVKVKSEVDKATSNRTGSMSPCRIEETNDSDEALRRMFNLNKKKFFSSDTDDSSCSEEGEPSDPGTDDEPVTKKSDPELEKKPAKGEDGSKKGTADGVDEEESELRHLLRMTNVSLTGDCKREGKVGVESKVADSKPEKKKEKQQAEEESLLDIMENQSPPKELKTGVGENEPSEEKADDFEARINNGMKNAFLMSSSEASAEEETADEQTVNKPEKKEKDKPKERKSEIKNKRKSDGLSNFPLTVTSSSSDDDDSIKDDASTAGKKVKTVEIEVTDEESDDNSDSDSTWCSKNSGSCSSSSNSGSSASSCGSDRGLRRQRNVKVEHSKDFRQIVLTDSDSSDSDIQQIPIPKSQDSPVKGRKNINKILKKDFLEVGTKQARKLEAERKKRLAERRKLFEELGLLGNESKLVLDIDPETREPLVVVDRNLASRLKPHQRQGVRFMWDCCFESVKRLEEDSGSGCILAHCMGLGKTLQVIALIHTVLTHGIGVKSVMILCPLNTVTNWLREFRAWLRKCRNMVKPFEIISCKTKGQKAAKIKLWANSGGVLVISYEVFRTMMKKLEFRVFSSALVDPGPDLVVCDEGHLLKNENSALSKCISQVKTLRRIVLTGTPLQNNLIEYYCMVQFVKPNILGTRKEFMNGFVNPIKNGQFEDSTQLDVRIMKRRAHVLHTLLDGFIQRFSYCVLTPFLPEKQEYVISVSLTPTQDKIYRNFLEKGVMEGESGPMRTDSLFNDVHWLQKVWTHPRLLLNTWEKHVSCPDKVVRPERMKENWGKFVREDEYNTINSSGKVRLLFQILKECKRLGEKILVFSQYLSTLDLIEHFLKIANKSHADGSQSFEFADRWVLGQDYFRMDGSTNCNQRSEFCKVFNDKNNHRSRLFLISTRAGGLGINLVAANRVIVFDVSWNPSHDLQSIFRVYRFGQTKPCYIYRFLAEATIEEKIYKRQVTKLSLAYRILDEHQIERHYSMMNLQELYSYKPTPKSEWKVPKVPKDNLFAEILATNRDIIVGYHEHDSLLENKEDEELTEEERRAAWEDFEKERAPVTLASAVTAPPPPRYILPAPGPSTSDINREVLQMISSYSRGRGTPKAPVSQVRPRNLIINQSQDQMCRIVDVRTLNDPTVIDRLSTEESREEVLSIGRTMGIVPHENEDFNSFRTRLRHTMQQILFKSSPFVPSS